MNHVAKAATGSASIAYIYDIGSLVPEGLPSKEVMIQQFQQMFGPKVVPVETVDKELTAEH